MLEDQTTQPHPQLLQLQEVVEQEVLLQEEMVEQEQQIQEEVEEVELVVVHQVLVALEVQV